MSGRLRGAVARLGAGVSLSEAEAHEAVGEIVTGTVADITLAAFLTALRVKGETADELVGAVRAVRDCMGRWDRPAGSGFALLDTCGTGGDGANTINISTATAIVVAATGVPVAKHGNRSASGNSGSAEVLTELGIEIGGSVESLSRCLEAIGLVFLYAPSFHPALRHAASVRKQLPFRTIFNLVGPLANPARPEYQLVGVPTEPLARLVAGAIARLGVIKAAVVRGGDGLDEVSLGGPTLVLMVEDGRVDERTWTPEEFGLSPHSSSALRVSGPAESAKKILAVFGGERGPVRDAILANSAAGLLVAGRVGRLADGVSLAADTIDAGRAMALLERWRAISRHGDS